MTLYLTDYTIPNGSQEELHLMNGIEKYDEYYYIVAGKGKSNELYLFDKNILSSSTDCYQTYYAKVYFDPDIPLTSISYQPNSVSKTVFTTASDVITTIYNVICQ